MVREMKVKHKCNICGKFTRNEDLDEYPTGMCRSCYDPSDIPNYISFKQEQRYFDLLIIKRRSKK